MQVNSSVNTRYYTSYRTERSVKYGAGMNQTEEGKISSNETTENPGFTEFVNNQASRQMWNDLGNLLMPVSQRDENAAKYIGISFEELGEDRVGAMRLTHGINQIVTAKNPEDGKEYLTYFTDKSIVCQNKEGTTVWTMSITEAQAALVKEYFEGYEANHGEEPAWYFDESLGIVSSEEFWMEFFEGASIGDSSEIIQKPADGPSEETTDYYEFIRVKIEELFVKIQNGDTESRYQIGSQSFTEKEWEEFLDRFDSLEEAIQELMKEEQERKEAEEAKKENVVIDAVSILLTTESTSCVYETADPDDDDIRYITWYTEEGIFCRKAGQTVGYKWSIVFENKEQYNKVMEFIGQFPSDWNMRFAAHENFWNDFLNEEIDLDGFMEFIKGTNKGIPDFSITVGNSMYVDKYMPSVWKSNIKN